MNVTFSVCIPVLNGATELRALLPALASQTTQPCEILIADSESDDDSKLVAEASGARVVSVRRSEFDHGATRQQLVLAAGDVSIAVFLTQDALPARPDAFARLLAPFTDSKVAASYGRQLPRDGAGAAERHARLFNYPDRPQTRNRSDARAMGLKAAFCSNSFSAFRVSTLKEVGGFSSGLIFGEDQLAAAHLLLQGYRIAYASDAWVTHSHDYSVIQEAKRYFDIGVFHTHSHATLKHFGRTEREGMRFALSEAKYVLRHEPFRVPTSIIRSMAKYAAYRLGRVERFVPRALKAKLSMNRRYWSLPQRGGS